MAQKEIKTLPEGLKIHTHTLVFCLYLCLYPGDLTSLPEDLGLRGFWEGDKKPFQGYNPHFKRYFSSNPPSVPSIIDYLPG